MQSCRPDADWRYRFENAEEEASYYRDKYRVAVDLLNETRAELGAYSEPGPHLIDRR